MTNSINEKFKSVFKLLRKRNLTIISEVSDDLKCGICEQVLIDAHITSCGCKFCKGCIDNYKKKLVKCCPGNTEDCQYDGLSDLIVDRSTNMQISRLVVRCGNENCDFECELMKMEIHMDTCSMNQTNCPLEIFGCKEILNCNKINQHLQRENVMHNKLLMELINNFKNEMNELRENDVRNRNEIAILKENVENQRNEIQVLKENADLMKKEIEDKRNEIGKMRDEMKEKVNLKDSNEKLDSIQEDVQSIKSKMENEFKIKSEAIEIKLNERFKTEFRAIQSNLSRRWEQINLNNKDEMENVKNDMIKMSSGQTENLQSIENEMERLRERNRKRKVDVSDMKTKVSHLEKYLDIKDGIFVWHIDKIDKLEKGRIYFSEFFYDRSNLYKMGLKLCLSADNILNITVLVFSGSNDQNICWPFATNVTIRIVQRLNQNRGKSITKSCSFDRPVSNQCKWSDVFQFDRSDLLNIGINHSCIIECISNCINWLDIWQNIINRNI